MKCDDQFNKNDHDSVVDRMDDGEIQLNLYNQIKQEVKY